MKKEKLEKYFNAQVAHLQRTIAPDDIYVFAQETLLAASFFLAKFSEWVDLEKEMQNDKATAIWVRNIVSLQAAQRHDILLKLNLDMKMVDDL